MVSKPRPVAPKREGGVAAAIIELDSLPDSVRAAAEDHDLPAVANLGLVLGFAEQRRLVGRIEIGRRGIELGSAAVDPLEHRPHAEPKPVRAHLGLGDAPGHRRNGSWTMPEPPAATASLIPRSISAERSDSWASREVGKAHRFQPPHVMRIARKPVDAHFLFCLNDLL